VQGRLRVGSVQAAGSVVISRCHVNWGVKRVRILRALRADLRDLLDPQDQHRSCQRGENGRQRTVVDDHAEPSGIAWIGPRPVHAFSAAFESRETG
jgi:hypothetical protein